MASRDGLFGRPPQQTCRITNILSMRPPSLAQRPRWLIQTMCQASQHDNVNKTLEQETVSNHRARDCCGAVACQ
eukprot:2329355-Amphidinium_carterae.1